MLGTSERGSLFHPPTSPAALCSPTVQYRGDEIADLNKQLKKVRDPRKKLAIQQSRSKLEGQGNSLVRAHPKLAPF
eukprot:SAG11_NODE_8212_length_1046_cov_1.403379_3_plen_76_part_00